MIVFDKKSNIAVMRTLGMSSWQIIMIFITQGLSIGVIGTFLGFILGVILSINATDIFNWIQTFFHKKKTHFWSSLVIFDSNLDG